MKMLPSQYRENAMDPDQPLYQEAAAPDPERMMKPTAFHTSQVTVAHGCAPQGKEKKEIRRNKKRIHTATVQEHISTRPIHPLLITQPPEVHKSAQTLGNSTRRILAQLRAQKSPLLQKNLHNIGAADNPNCPLCGYGAHNTAHMFNYPSIPTELMPLDLWRNPVPVTGLLQE